MTKEMNIRKVALAVLDKISAAGQYSNIALDTAIARSGVSGPDRALLTALVYGTVEKRITLDYLIDSLSSLPPSKIELSVRNILRMGFYQLIYLDRVPDHAAINESVNLTGKRQKGFVNALLRNFTRGGRSLPLPEKEDGIGKYLSVKYSVSEGICERFCTDFGEERAEKLLSSMDNEPYITLRVNTLKITRDELLERFSSLGISAEKTELSDYGIRLTERYAYSDIPFEEDGLWFVQDEASQLCSAVLGAKAGETVIDSCACPGGKSFSVAMCMENEGRLMSFDLHENKLSLIERGAKRLGINIIRTAAKDGKIFDDTLTECADRILCDLPCSGLGVIAKKPDIRYKNMADIENLPDIQMAIAENSLRYLKKDGVMVYSTCTILPAENENNVKRLLDSHDDIEAVPFEYGGKTAGSGMLTLYPDEHGTDGFFIAKIRKK
ncbi:MAG: 16S rRNA (cytosine(967)-C(5))-methyltransferase RsmB [Ruminococcaceae bacterium]|nr:16S rRNA (cytosine(967)-C(5))-methyltransferase RsmB [Oscillospiraceae bacterium]